MKPPNIDISKLPDFAYGHHSLIWWGTLGYVAIEATFVAMLLGAYLYGAGYSGDWPPHGITPSFLLGTINTMILLVGLWPNHIYKTAAEKEDLPRASLWLWISVLVGIAFLTVRGLEFAWLQVSWDSHFYGSIIWTILGFHTLLILSDVIDSAALAYFLRKGPVHRRRFDDVSADGAYWYFTIVAWMPIYLIIYVLPQVN